MSKCGLARRLRHVSGRNSTSIELRQRPLLTCIWLCNSGLATIAVITARSWSRVLMRPLWKSPNVRLEWTWKKSPMGRNNGRTCHPGSVSPVRHEPGRIYYDLELLLVRCRLHKRMRSFLPHGGFQSTAMPPEPYLQLRRLSSPRRQLPLQHNLVVDSDLTMHWRELWNQRRVRCGSHGRRCV